MTLTTSPTPAPVRQQAPPTRGALLLTTGTACAALDRKRRR